MIYRILADLVVVAHLVFIVFGLFGGLLALHRARWALLHLPAVAWISALEFNAWICPLTPLENRLRQLAGDAGYHGGFIEHYLIPLIYPPGLTHSVQQLLGWGALLLNAAIYTWVVKRIRQRAKCPGSSNHPNT